MITFEFPEKSVIYKKTDKVGAFHVVKVDKHIIDINEQKRKTARYQVEVMVGKGHKPGTLVIWTKKFVENHFTLIDESAIKLTEVLFS